MLRKATLATSTALLALTTAYAQPQTMTHPTGMHHQAAQMGMQGPKATKKRGMRSIFLIRRGLPHYSMILMRMWDDPQLALTPDQKSKLETIRRETMRKIMTIAPRIKKLRRKIVKASRSGASAQALYGDVDKLATLEAEATKIQLACIEKTNEVLTPRQKKVIAQHLKKKRKKHKK